MGQARIKRAIAECEHKGPGEMEGHDFFVILEKKFAKRVRA